MVDKSVLGFTTEPAIMPIERGKVREFAKACKSEDPAYVEGTSPVIPPTFLATMSFWTDPKTSAFEKLGLDIRRVLHGAQEFVFHGPPPRAGTDLTFRTRIDKIYEKEGRRGGTMTFVEQVTEFLDPAGTLVAESRITGIETAKPPTEG
jgi:hypothetical protein